MGYHYISGESNLWLWKNKTGNKKIQSKMLVSYPILSNCHTNWDFKGPEKKNECENKEETT